MREPRTPPPLRRLFSAAAVVCAVLLTTLPAPAQTNPTPDPAPNYDSPQLCETLGGTLLPVGDANICQNLDATGTFCIIASRDAFPCRGLFKHVIRCHDYNRPAINPFICGPVCENGSPLGGTCRLPFADAVLVPGQPFTFTRNSASRTGVYHGQRRALHYIYFTAPNIFRQNRDRIHLVTHSDHAAHCALGNPEGKTSPWRVPTLAETAVLLADAPADIAVVSDANPEGNPPPDTSFRLPLPPDSCAGQCAPPLANLSAASANAVQTANLLRPEILTPAPQPVPSAIQTEQSLSALRAAPPAFTRAPHQTRNPNLVFPCVASAVSGYQPPPLDSRVKITPSGAPVQTHADPQIIHPSYAAPNAPDIPAAAPLLTVSAVAQRWTIIAENNLPTLAEHPVPVTVRADIGGNQQRLIATGKVVLPILAASAINARAPALIPVSVAASPEIGPVQTQIFHYANIPVETPPPVTAVVLASIVQIPVSISAEGETVTSTLAVTRSSIAYAEINLPPEMSGETETATLAVVSPLPADVQYQPDLPNLRLIRRGPVPTRPEQVRARLTHPAMRGDITLAVVFRPVQTQPQPGEFVPAGELKRGGFAVSPLETVPLFTLTSAVPATRLEFVQPLNADPFNYHGFTHRAAGQHGGHLEFSAVPPRAVVSEEGYNPAHFFIAYNPPFIGNVWRVIRGDNYKSYIGNDFYGSGSHADLASFDTSECVIAPGGDNIELQPTAAPGHLTDIYQCPARLCAPAAAAAGHPPEALQCPEYLERVEITGDFVVATPKQGGGYDYAPYDETKRTEGALNSVPMVVNNPQACVPVAQARAAGIIPPENPLSDANGPTTKYGGEIMFCPPLRRVASVIVAAQNPAYETRPFTTEVRNSLGVLVPQTIRAAALLTLEITVSVRREAAEFDPHLYFPRDATADFLRASQSRGKTRYHPALAAPDFASQLSVLAVHNGATIHVIRHPIMAVNIPPNHRYDIVMPAHGGFALTVLPRGQNTYPVLPPGAAPPRQTPQSVGNETDQIPVAYPNRPAEIRYVEAENPQSPDATAERLAVFYVPPNLPIPAQTSRQGVVRYTVIRLSEANGETLESVAGSGSFTISITALAKMPVYDSGSTDLNERFNYWTPPKDQHVVPPEILGMQNIIPELISDNLLKDGEMTYLGAQRPQLLPGHVHNPLAFTIAARNATLAFQLQLNTTLETAFNALSYGEARNINPLFAGDHIISVKYSNPNVFLGEYHMTFRAQMPPVEDNIAHWDAAFSVEEGVRRMLAYTPEQLSTLDIFGAALADQNTSDPTLTPLEEAVLHQQRTAEWLRRAAADLNKYADNPEITVLLERAVPANDYNAALRTAAEWVHERTFPTDDIDLVFAPVYLPYSLAQYDRYVAPAAVQESRILAVVDFLSRHAPAERIKTARIAEGYAGPVFTYDPKLSFPFQSADIRAEIPETSPNHFKTSDGRAGMRRRLPNGGILEIVEAGDGRLQARIPRPLPRITSGNGLESYIRSTVVNFLYPVPEPPASIAHPATVAVTLPTIRAKGNEGDGEHWDTSRPEKGVVSWINPETFLLESFPYDLTLTGAVLMRPTLYAYAPEGGREILLSLQVTVREIRSYTAADAILHIDLQIENGANLPPLEIPAEDATAGKNFEIRLPDAWRYPRGGKWSIPAPSAFAGPTLSAGRISLTSALAPGFYVVGLNYAPRGANNMLGGVPYRFALNVVSLKTEAQAATEIANAAAAGDRAEVSRLLRDSPVPGTAKAASGTYAGKTPLHAALMGFASSDTAAQTEARINIVWELVENGANWWTVDNEGLAPMHRALHSAAQNRTVLPVRALSSAPFALREKLQRTATKGAPITVSYLAATGPQTAPMADGFTTPLQYGAAQYNEALSAALSGGSDALVDGWAAALSAFDKLYNLQCQRSTERSTALCLTQLVDQRRDESGETPLHTAVRMQQTMTVESLLAAGADVNVGLISAVEIGASPSPMHYAVSLADARLVSLMALGFEKGKVNGECPLGIIPTVSGVNFSEGNFAMTVSECRVRTNYKPGASWILDAANYPSVAITPPIYATILLSEALSASPQDGARITMLRQISLMLNPQITLAPIPDPPGAPIINRVVGADFAGERYTVYWRPPASDGGAPITAYVIEREQTVQRHSFRHPTHCGGLSDSDYSQRTVADVLPAGGDFAFQSVRDVRGGGTAGDANGLCFRWRVYAMNRAGSSSVAVTSPILSRGFNNDAGAWTDWDVTRDSAGTACPAGEYRPYAYRNWLAPDAASWGLTCYPGGSLGRGEICHRLRIDGHNTAYDAANDECRITAAADSTLCGTLGHADIGRQNTYERCRISPPCGTLSEYNIHHRQCLCSGWAVPATLGDSTACKCEVLDADANCACPTGRRYNPLTHSCILN